jgi:hypothetical protein
MLETLIIIALVLLLWPLIAAAGILALVALAIGLLLMYPEAFLIAAPVVVIFAGLAHGITALIKRFPCMAKYFS